MTPISPTMQTHDRARPGHEKSSGPLVIGIESTCDETGVGIVQGSRLLADVVASSMEEHARYGGVIPEIAARAHLEAMMPTLRVALGEAGIELRDADALAVAFGPGLAGPLSVGVAAAKALALGTGLPLYGVNHVVAHAAVTELAFGELPERFLSLVVSGGHTALLDVRDVTGGPDGHGIRQLGATLDDAAGEAFDKVARLLGFPYPGGPHVDAAARRGDPRAIHFPRALTQGRSAQKHPFDFSFSGVKTAVARWIEARQDAGLPIPVEDVCASFAAAVADVLSAKTVRAARRLGVTTVIVGGGFSANSQLRDALAERCGRAGLELRIPPLRYCTDNGAMIAALGSAAVRADRTPAPLDLGIDSVLDLEHPLAV